MQNQPNHLPASPAAFGAILQWIAQAMAFYAEPGMHGEPDPRLLTEHGMPQGSIRKAEARRDPASGQTMILMTFRKPKEAFELVSDASADGSPHLFDPAGAALVRVLLLFGGSIYEDAKTRGKFHELQYGDAGRSVLRIITGAGPGEHAIKNPTNHQDLRRGGLMKRPHKGGRLSARDEAVEIALESFKKNASKAHLPVTKEYYEWLIRTLFDLIDKVPLRTNAISAGEASAAE